MHATTAPLRANDKGCLSRPPAEREVMTDVGINGVIWQMLS
jgi:hypothetical protein